MLTEIINYFCLARILFYYPSMDDLLINIIGMGNQGSAAGTASLKESTGAESKQKDFLSILTSIISGSDSQESLLKKLKEINESGEPGLAHVMSSISSLLTSMIPPETGKDASAVIGEKLPETSQKITGLEGLSKEGTAKQMNNLSGWLEQMNYSALQGILTDPKSEKVQGAASNQDGKEPTKEGQSEIDQITAFQKEMMKLLTSMKGELESTTGNEKVPSPDSTAKTITNSAIALNLQQEFLKERQSSGSDLIQVSQKMPVATEVLSRDLLEKNAGFLRAILEKGGQVNREDGTKGNSLGEGKGFDGALKLGEARTQGITSPLFLDEQSLDENGGQKPEAEAHALLVNAAKKYKEHVAGTEELKANTDPEITSVSSEKSSVELPQGDTFRANVFQVKDNNMTFEKGSFTSFVNDRIEKIVEQFSSRNSQMDMVVRLKLDDKETLLIGLRHEGQKVIVDVKASNDGLVNLLQAHKDDIARNLQDKNIFTNIFVQPDGERNSERQNQRDNNKENKKQEASASFASVLEATA